MKSKEVLELLQIARPTLTKKCIDFRLWVVH